MSSGSNDNHRLGVFGGTFDPPHLGHLILAETAADALDLAQVLFVPAGQPPHKDPAEVRAPAQHRLAMVERAIAGNPRFALSRADLDRPGPHYSVDTLRLLGAAFPGATLFFLIGADSLRDLPTWHQPADVIAQAWLGAMRRPGTEPDLSALEEQLPGVTDRVRWVDAPRIEISSSSLVRRIAAGLSVRYQLPDSVRAYIQEHGLYRKSP